MATSKNNSDKDAVQDKPTQDEVISPQSSGQEKTEEKGPVTVDPVKQSPESAIDTPPRKDLTRLCTVNWPTNRVFRSVINCAVRDLELEMHQSADFVTLPDTFVFEGLDVVPTKAVSEEILLQLELDDGRILGRFILKGESMERVDVEQAVCVGEGTLLRNARVTLRNAGDAINGDGRLAFVFKGYSLEHWR